MKLHTIVGAFLVAALLSAEHTEAAYKKLNSYLIDKVVNNDEIGPNMGAAMKWLKELEFAKRSLFSRSPIDEVRRFTALQQVMSDIKCDGAVYELIESSVQATDLVTLIKKGQVVRRVDKLLEKIFTNHAQRCLKVYPTVYRTKKEEFNEGVLKQVRSMAQSVLDADRFMMDTITRLSSFGAYFLYNNYVARRSPLTSLYPNVLHKHLLNNYNPDEPLQMYANKVPDERTGKKAVHKDQIKELVRNQIIEPCRLYEAHFGPDLFVPASSDQRFYSAVDDNNVEYYYGWMCFKICQAVTMNEAETFNNVINSVKELP